MKYKYKTIYLFGRLILNYKQILKCWPISKKNGIHQLCADTGCRLEDMQDHD